MRWRKAYCAGIVASALFSSGAAFADSYYKPVTSTVLERIAHLDNSKAFFTALPAMLFSGGNNQIIDNIQQVSVTIGSGASSNTATISSIDTSRTVLYWNGKTVNTNSPNSQNLNVGVTLTNSTTITANRTGTGSVSVTVYLTAVQYKAAAIQSVQYGSQVISSGTSANATISSVNTSNAFALSLGGTRTGTGTTPQAYTGAVRLTGATTVECMWSTSGNNPTPFFCVVEFKTGILASAVQNFSVALTSVSSNTATISSVTTTQTVLTYGGYTDTNSSTGLQTNSPRVELTNATTITANKSSTAGSTSTFYGSVLEFSASLIKSMQRGTIVISGSATNTATVSSVSVTKTIIGYLGQEAASGTGGNVQEIIAYDIQTSGTIVTAGVNTTPGGNVTVSYEVAEFY